MTFEYDQYGNRISTTDPAGAVTSFAYDGQGNMTSQTDANGTTTAYEYDAAGRLVKVIDPTGNATSYTYDRNGNRASQTDANGNTTFYEYNYKGQLVRVTDALGNTTTYAYGGAGCASCSGGGEALTSVTDANGNITRFEYDSLGRKVKEIDPLENVTSFTYDAKGNVLTKTDALGRTTAFTYDTLGRVVSIVDPLNGAVRMAYNSRGQVTGVTDAAGNTTSYEYDFAGRQTKVMSPDAGTTSYTYNPDGSVRTKTNANGVTATYHYDSAGRLVRMAFPDASDDIVYEYGLTESVNGKGRLSRMTDPSGSATYNYDPLGRATREIKTVLGVSYATGYEHDKSGAVKSVTYPSGRKIGYTLDKVNRPVGVSSTLRATEILANNFAYSPTGALTSITPGNGLTQTWTYDAAGRVSFISAPGIFSFDYSYDKVGNITGIADSINPSSSRAFAYDALDRLTQATGPWGKLTWTYDANGNRLTQSNGINYKYTYDGNRLTSIANGHVSYYQYHNAGNITADGNRDFIYNQNQRLIRASVDGKTVGEYAYDGKGRRVIKKTGLASVNSASSQNTIYHYDLSGKLIEETSGDGKLLVNYVYLSGAPLAMIRKQGNGEETFFYHNDHLGTPKVITDKLKKIVWNIELDPFGNEVQNKGRKGGYIRSVENNLRFPGQYYDEETGLHYNWHRDYDPKTGRYVEADPIGLNSSNNLYNYQNNPIKNIDIFGLYLCTYDVSEHRMSCIPNNVNNALNPQFDSSDFVSGNNLSPSCCDCQDNPARDNVPDHGPIPDGEYTIGAQRSNSSRRDLYQDPNNIMHNRFGFQIHGCSNRSSCSSGCIAATTNAIRDELNRILSLEEGNNTLHVQP